MLYEPPHFNQRERLHALALIAEHPLGTLVSVVEGDAFVSHAPLQASVNGERLALIGHIAKPNAHWRAWETAGTRVTAIFHGPNSYVSPSWYEAPEAVPTWNYMVVHAEGAVRVMHDSADKERVLKALIDEHDAPYHAHWNEVLTDDYRERMKLGIVAFEIEVDKLRAKFKLSQNRSAFDKNAVLTAMEQGEGTRGDDRRALGRWMRRLGIGT